MGVDNRGATKFFILLCSHSSSVDFSASSVSKDENWKLKGQGLSLDLIVLYAWSFSLA